MITPPRITNALDRRLAAARNGDLALVTYLTAGFPDAESTCRWAALAADAGAAIIELGVPFSDPIGDGPSVQRASQHALAGGMSLAESLTLAAEIGRCTPAPLVLLSYYNPILSLGLGPFAQRVASAGVSGVIVPDLPLEEAEPLAAALGDASVHLIAMVAPTSPPERIARTARRATGFLYCMARTGVTGARAYLDAELPAFLARVRAETEVPLVVGFGLSTPAQLRAVGRSADGAIVASALIDLIEQTPAPERDAALGSFIATLRQACARG
jgi:tryptophan synthase alpha chain